VLIRREGLDRHAHVDVIVGGAVASWLHCSLLVSRSSRYCSSPSRGCCVVILGKTLYSHSTSLHPAV